MLHHRSRRCWHGWRVAIGLLATGCVGLLGFWDRAGGQDQPPRLNQDRIYPVRQIGADKVLRNADVQAKAGLWAEAIDLYLRVIEQHGDSVTKLPVADPATDSQLFVDTRLYCQHKLLELPPEGRKVYRDRVDPQAERWFRKGAQTRDLLLLRKVAEEAFVSSWGDDALELLGDLAFQDGRFNDALTSYRRIVPDDRALAHGLVYPDPSVDKALIAAKKLLCRAALGQDPPTDADFEAYRKAYPDAVGKLAGRTGLLDKTVETAIKEDHLTLADQRDSRWPTFAGAPTRTKVAADPIDVGSLQWRVDLTTVTARRNNFPGRREFVPASGVERRLPFHPIVLGDQVLVCDGRHVTAYNLNDRSTDPNGLGPVPVAWLHDQFPAQEVDHATINMDAPQFTITAYNDRIYARMEPWSAGRDNNRAMGGMGGMGVSLASRIVAIDRVGEGKLLWKIDCGEIALPNHQGDGNRPNIGFEGTPVADAENVYVAMTEGGWQTTTYVACMSAETGSVKWVRFLFQAMANPDNLPMRGRFRMQPNSEVGHRLLSLDNGSLFYQSNSGAVAALDAQTGSIRWIATYPMLDANGLTTSRKRDLNPAVVHDGLVIVAPDDTPFILAFDASSGSLVWKMDPQTEILHLLGVAKGRLVATGDHVVTIDVKTGKRLSKWPDHPAGFDGYGRGVLAGDSIYWPTKTEIHVLDQSTGLRGNQPPIKLKETFQVGGGNLAVGDGYLVIAQADSMVVLCQNSRLIRRYRDAIAKAPDQASNYFRLAQVSEAIGEEDMALRSLDAAIKRGKASEMLDGQSLIESAWEQKYKLLLKLGSRAALTKDWGSAIVHYEDAATAARSDRARLAARLNLADAQSSKSDYVRAVATLQGLLADQPLRGLTLAADDHRVVRADLLVADRLAAVVREHGREIYGPYDEAAGRQLAEGITDRDPKRIEDVARLFPISTVVPNAWLALGRLRESLDEPAEAASAYKRLLAVAVDDPQRAEAFFGLARAYETQRLWIPAREAYNQLAGRFGDLPIGSEGNKTAARVVAERLARAPFDRYSWDGRDPSLPLPLARRWLKRWQTPVRTLIAEGVPPSATSSRIFLVEKTAIRPIDPTNGDSPWSVDLDAEPKWAGYLADHVVTASDTRITALNPAKGGVAWQYDLNLEGAGEGAAKRRANPFSRDPGRPQNPLDGAARGLLHGFQIVGSRLFCLRGDRELLAFDGDSGLLDWSYATSSESINPNQSIGARRIVLQERNPNTIVVLETDSGRRVTSFPQPEKQNEWPRKPLPIDDDHVVIVTDRITVALLDLRTGHSSWTFQESKVLPTHGPPRAIGDGERLLVLHDGTELIRLDPASGSKLWSQILGSEDLADRAGAIVVEGNRCYYVVGSSRTPSVPTINALALETGKLVWSRILSGPRGGWTLALSDRWIAAYPSISAWASNPDLDALPLAFYTRDQGELIQRLVFPATSGQLAVGLADRGALVATPNAIWSLGDRKPVDAGSRPR